MQTNLLRQLWGFYAACASILNESNALGNPKGVQRIASVWRKDLRKEDAIIGLTGFVTFSSSLLRNLG